MPHFCAVGEENQGTPRRSIKVPHNGPATSQFENFRLRKLQLSMWVYKRNCRDDFAFESRCL